MPKYLYSIILALVVLTACQSRPQPVNPNASPEARELLSFLYSISGEYTLSGEHNFASDLTRYDAEVYAMTGKWPVVWGSDFSFNDIGEGFERYQHAGPLNLTVPFERPCVQTGLTVAEARQGIVDEAIRQWKRGRIITLMWHCCDPRFTDGNDCNGDKVWTMDQGPSEQEWDALCTEGTELHAAWQREMDTVIPYLAQLRDAGVPVLWRPYHEMNGAWFWWGNKPGEQGFKRLWIMTYKYFTGKGLDNLLWVWDPNAPRVKENDDAYPYADFYPGNEYVDVLAADIYAWDYKQSHHDELVELGGGKPIAMGEVGQLPKSVEVFQQQPRWTWFMVWGYFIGSHRNTEDHLNIVRSLYDAPRILTLDEISFENGKHKVIAPAEAETTPKDTVYPLGFCTDSFRVVAGTIGNGENFTGWVTRLGLPKERAMALTQACDTVFDVRKMRAGNSWRAYYKDSTALQYIVYENNRTLETIFGCRDSLAVWTYQKPVELLERATDVTINSSLWNDMTAAGASPDLILELSEIYAWTVDFFGLQKGDRFRCLYLEKMCEGESVGIDRISYAEFLRDSTCLSAIYFDQGDGGNTYWNEKGESMRKAFLKAPLKFTRISSGYSLHRLHPVHGTVRAHTGVDYAAPTGTPVMSIGDGTVISTGWGGGGGKTVKIRHNSVYTTAYLHLSKYAVKAGQRVSQGQVIGYVGMTGTATGPHLDFRVWKNGSPINPLKMESPPADPILPENLPALDSVYRQRKNVFYR